MDNKIKQNLVYLADNFTNLDRILLYLIQNDIISPNESDDIRNKDTPFNKNFALLDVLQRKDLPINTFLKILRNTQNGHCADKIEGISPDAKERKLEKPKLLKSVWWPKKKILIKSLHERKIGEKLFIEELYDRISKDEKRILVICESVAAAKLTGLGGVGKTVTATWYANKYENEYDHVIWIDSGEDSLLKSFQKLARDLEVKNRNELMDLEDFSRKSYETLEEFKCLWIFDNAERYRGEGGIQKILPVEKTEFYCLITSRNKDWGIPNMGYGEISRLELDIFVEEEALEFFRVYLNEKIQYTESQLKELCRLLGYLPLAMQLAIAALNMGKIDLQNYIEKTTAADFDNIVDVEFDGYERTINKNMKITMELIREEISAYDILLICGYIRPDAIPKGFLKAVLNIDNEEFNSAMKLLTKYSLIGQETRTINEEKEKFFGMENWIHRRKLELLWKELREKEIMTEEEQEVFSIHRLLQQVIRHNGRKTEKDTLRRILHCKGFVEYKLLPFTKYTNEELRKEFPKVKAELLDQRQLMRLVAEERFDESVELAKLIDREIKTNATKFNYSICLGKNGQLDEEITALEELYGLQINGQRNNVDFEMVLLKLSAKVSKSLFGGHLLVSLWKTGNKARLQEILEERKYFQMIPSHEVTTVRRILNSNLINSNYSLACKSFMFEIAFGGDTKKIDLGDCSIDMSVPFPNDLQELVLHNVKFKDGSEKDINATDEWLPKKLNTLNISDYSQIILSMTFISSIKNILLEKCSLNLDSANRISPQILRLKSVSFVENGRELSNIKVNDFIDFSKVNRLELCYSDKNTLSIDLSEEESVNLEYIYLNRVNIVSLKSADGRVNIKEAEMWQCSLDLSILPSSLEKLSLSFAELSVSEEIDLPNLKYLELYYTPLLPHFRSLQLTYLYLNDVKEVNVDFLPPSTKIVKIDRVNWETRLLGGVIHLDKLILRYFSFTEVEKILPHFQTKQLLLSSEYKPKDLIELMNKQVPTIAIGIVDWKEEEFQNSTLSTLVDTQSEHYLFHQRTGKAIEKEDFDKLVNSTS